MRDEGDTTLFLVPQRGPRVELRARKPRGPAAQAAAVALDKAGYVVTRIKPLKEAQRNVTIWIDSKFESDSAALIAAVNGTLIDKATPESTDVDAVVSIAEAADPAPSK